MNKEQMQSMMTIDQRATCAKIKMLCFDTVEACNTEQEIGIFLNYLQQSLQQIAVNRMMSLNGSFIEQIVDTPDDSAEIKEPENNDTNETTEPA